MLYVPVRFLTPLTARDPTFCVGQSLVHVKEIKRIGGLALINIDLKPSTQPESNITRIQLDCNALRYNYAMTQVVQFALKKARFQT